MVFDGRTLRLLHTWPVGSDPIAVSGNGNDVWVANGLGDGTSVALGANTILEIDASTGNVVNTYGTRGPVDVIATSTDTAIALSQESQNGPLSAMRLTGGSVALLGTATGSSATTGSGMKLATAGGSVYALLSRGGKDLLERVSDGGFTDIANLPGGHGSLACSGVYCFVAIDNVNGGGVYRINLLNDLEDGGPWGDSYPLDISLGHGIVWVLHGPVGSSSRPRLQAMSPATGRYISSPVLLPGPDAVAVTSELDTAWSVSGGQLVEVRPG